MLTSLMTDNEASLGTKLGVEYDHNSGSASEFNQMKTSIFLPLELVLAGMFVGQSQAPSFEAASLKPAPPLRGPRQITRWSGGPGSSDPIRIRYSNVTLQQLLVRAYNVREDQVTGPSWIASSLFNLEAKLPEGSSKENLALMLQSLIAERFKIASHSEQTITKGFALIPAAGVTKPMPTAGHSPNGNNDFQRLLVPSGRIQSTHLPNRGRLAGLHVSLDVFAWALADELWCPVANETALSGTYDIILNFSTDEDGAGLSSPSGQDGLPKAPELTSEAGIFSSIQKQLGLKLKPEKISNRVLVIDHAEQTPIDN